MRYHAYMRTDNGHWWGVIDSDNLEVINEWFTENRDSIHRHGYTVSNYIIEDRQTGERKDVIK